MLNTRRSVQNAETSNALSFLNNAFEKCVFIIKKHIIDALLWCLFCVLIIFCFSGINTVRQYSRISLRFDSPISGQAAYAARRYSVAHSSEGAFWPTFWSEYKASFSNEHKTIGAPCIAYSGDAMLVWPATYLVGSAPGVTDRAGCAVSEEFARKRWGSIDVVGMTVEVNGAERVVRGVFEGKTELALISYRVEDTSVKWSAVELGGGSANAARSDVESFAAASGLGKPDVILMDSHSFIAGAMAILPLLAPAFYALYLIFRYIKRRYFAIYKPFLFLCLISLALLLPVILDAMPAWLIPTRWSDFQFWSSLLRQASDSLREFLSAAPRSRDVELRMLLLGQTGIAFLAVCCGISICFRWHLQQSNSSPVFATPR
jgi:hypothetical protein